MVTEMDQCKVRAVMCWTAASLVLRFGAACGQESNPPPKSNGPLPFATGSYLSSREFIVSFAVLGFGLVMTAAGMWLLRKGEIGAGDVIRMLALIIIVTGVLFLIAAGYSSQEVAPALGLLGTIAGYLLGRSDRGRRVPKEGTDE